MNSPCPERSLLDSFDSASSDLRAHVLSHAAHCPGCRGLLLADDPTRVFALLSLEAMAPSALAVVSTAVRARLAAGESRRRPWASVAGWAAAALLAVVTARTLWAPLAPVRANGAETIAQGGPRADIEVISPAEPRQVVDLTVGDSQVIMIFDERLRL